MSDTKKRTVPPKIANHPKIQDAFHVIAALLVAVNAKDLDCDFEMSGPHTGTQRFHFHVEKIKDQA